MSDVINSAVTALTAKMGGKGIEGGTIKFDVEGEGCVFIDSNVCPQVTDPPIARSRQARKPFKACSQGT